MAAQAHYYSKNPLNCKLMINDRSFFISYENIFFEIDNSLLIIFLSLSIISNVNQT